MTTGHEGQTYPPKLKAQHFRIAWRQLDDDDKVEVLNWLTEEAGSSTTRGKRCSRHRVPRTGAVPEAR